jgi:hypothetical protein
MFVKPGMQKAQNGVPEAPLRVRLLHAPRRLLSAAGQRVPDTQDWFRAMLRGDVVLAEPPAPPKPVSTPAPASKEAVAEPPPASKEAVAEPPAVSKEAPAERSAAPEKPAAAAETPAAPAAEAAR